MLGWRWGRIYCRIGTFAKGGEFNKRNANKIMRWRLGVQFVAVVVIAGFAWLRSKG